MRRAVLMFDGPKRFSKKCAGCALHDAAEKADDTCPIWGTLYRETKGDDAGVLLREDACIDNEIAVADETKMRAVWQALERGP